MSKRLFNEFFKRGYACTIDYGAIKQTEAPAVKTRICYDEGFTFCAGVSLGLCNLGAGGEGGMDCGIHGKDMLDLFDCLSCTSVSSITHDPHHLMPAAFIAIALIFMKTNDKTVLKHLSMNRSHQLPVHIQTLLHLTELIVKWNFDMKDFEDNCNQFMSCAQARHSHWTATLFTECAGCCVLWPN